MLNHFSELNKNIKNQSVNRTNKTFTIGHIKHDKKILEISTGKKLIISQK